MCSQSHFHYRSQCIAKWLDSICSIWVFWEAGSDLSDTGLHLPAGKTLVLPVMGRVASLNSQRSIGVAKWVVTSGHRQSPSPYSTCTKKDTLHGVADRWALGAGPVRQLPMLGHCRGTSSGSRRRAAVLFFQSCPCVLPKDGNGDPIPDT